MRSSLIFWPGILLLMLGLSSCASLQDFFNTLTGNSSQKITRTPIWVYMPDVSIAVDGTQFMGMAVTTLNAAGTDLSIVSPVDIDRVEMSTCSRHDVCQKKGGDAACNPTRFTVDTSWFGNPGKTMVYHFVPDAKEKDDSCANMQVAIYDKNALASWGYVVFRANPDANFAAHFTCNATDWTFKGVSVCSAKAGTIQEINFDAPVDDFRADASCNIKKISASKFDFQPAIGWCRASFMQNKKFHDVIMNGYDEVLIRDGSE